MNDFTEKRDFYRMAVDGQVRFRINGDKQISTGVVKNLSSTGLLMTFDKEIAPGTKMSVEISPGKSVTPPLSAEASVVRSDRGDQDGYNIACSIDRILAESEVGNDFP
ncbi:MAG: PilZ domain-containing protein [Candidatus Thiodiazotropha sp. (ex Dulcina madagascariensis)]|nr:PilZ domain-containing protein [Candidatus Thiodiazotropha sp. (ex Epidulcina cf. delphinae)]MCU7922832.1 PilZ domain-containing protein [Candidatus Thiodiazotropha sp. (ex Dulcina madagascariensis)]MCU7928360.1 PilZ domain-containing protein [Candidatus Thiodiazotropha sp. (ex Dulcina madagascariensis)]MCU7936669.1 PilZ domain-containing protein [Candidatus Thiodiazotropha sp. (ex Dulcina madagascariensis)]